MARQTPSLDSWERSYSAAFLTNRLAFVIEHHQLRWLTWGFFWFSSGKISYESKFLVSFPKSWVNLIKRRETRCFGFCFIFSRTNLDGSRWVWAKTLICTFVPRLQVGWNVYRDLRLDLQSQSRTKSRACERSCLVLMGFMLPPKCDTLAE